MIESLSRTISQNKEIFGIALLLALVPVALVTPIVIPLFVSSTFIYGITLGEILFIFVAISVMIWWMK